ncbi:hypothetical protein FKP32DRAFT_1608603 [Trametes sanguinea]|nr:hypothetical protein FKP32DRAFT_1608603 [Trametes sanguinea]
MKKGEAWINTVTPTLTYLMRCNTDVTSLLSGTAIKSVIAYVADYITKTPLKTHVMFQSIREVFERNTELLGSHKASKEKARSLITKTVNALTACSEIGGPMAAMYLLKHPDHYKSHKFRTCFWKGYVYEVMRAWEDSDKIAEEGPMKVILGLAQNGNSQRVVALSPYESMSLYDWIRLSDKKRKYNYKQSPEQEEPIHVDVDSEFEDNYEIDGDQGRVTELIGNDELLLTHHSNKQLQECIAPTAGLAQSPRCSKYVLFHTNHPQYNTHYVKLLDDSEAFVPNFIGGSMPRRDTGNREHNSEVKRHAQMLQAEQIIRASGWLDPMAEKTNVKIPAQFWSKEDLSASD